MEPTQIVDQSKQTTVLDKKKNELDNSLTYHRWFLGMECRKDILFENQILNNKIRQKMTPLSERLIRKAKQNRWRMGYFVGFCVLFSMDKLYNMLVIENNQTKKLQKRVQNLMINKKTTILMEQQQIKKIFKKTGLSQEKIKQISESFLYLDKNFLLNADFMTRVNGNGKKYDYDYVDMGTFVQYFKQKSVQELRSQILGQYPHANLTY